MGGIDIELLHELAGDAGTDGRWWYRLADAQLGRYRPATHRYLVLDPEPVEPGWLPLTDRLVSVPGDRRGRALLPTFTAPVVGREVDCDRWYSDHHVPEVIGVDGFAAGQRFACADPRADHPRLALYEIVDDDPGAALDRLTTALPSMVHTDALDAESIASWLYLPVDLPLETSP